MSMNLIAILVSLAMMLTGAGGIAQPEAALPTGETARTLTLNNVNVTWNGETLQLDPQVRFGVSTDGKKALYDFAVELGDKVLLPMQLSADEKGLTVLSGNSGVAVTVTAEALAGLAAQMEEQVNASLTASGGDNAQLMQFLTEEYMPAYAGLLKLAMDPVQRQQINAMGQTVYDRVVDRGQGMPAKLEVDGVSYDVTAYSYSLDALQMAALSDAMFDEVPELKDYYSALFKLYGMLPEESGLKGLDSFTALFERFGVQMRMDIEEKRTDDGAVDQMNNVLTMDLNSMMNVPQGLATVEAEMKNVEPETLSEGENQMAGEPLEIEAEAADAGEAEAPDAATEAAEEAEAPEAAPEAAEEAEAAEAATETAEETEAAEAATETAEETEAAEAAPEVVGETEAAEAAPEVVGETEAAEAAPEIADETEAPVLAPIVMNLHSLKLPEYNESTGSCVYAIDEHHSVDFSMTASESEGVQEMAAKVIMLEDGKKAMGGKMSAFMAYDEMGTVSYSMSMKAIRQDTAKAEATFYGVENPDGTSENSAAFELRTRKLNASVSFDLNVTADAIEDATAAAQSACVIEDLSQEGIQALGQDSEVMGKLMQALGSVLVDFNTLKADPGMKSLRALRRGKGMPIDVDELDEVDVDIDFDIDEATEEEGEDYGLVVGEDGDYELVVGDGDETAFDFEDEPVEDDGVLAFAQPELSWLPSGWSVSDVETDTAYDWVQMTVTDADGAECAYAIFFLDPEAGTANYIVQDGGKVLDGRMMNVTDFGEGGLSVTVSENGMYGNLMFNSEAIELDTIGQIVAGIEF
ncbi:MAG: hypothetical protein IJI26_06045 [Clostridia bacterium]|nr:hypothetical protein [Clostridia bacterium]